MSFSMSVTRLVCTAHANASSNNSTIYISAASLNASTVSVCMRNGMSDKFCNISSTRRWNESRGTSGLNDACMRRISFNTNLRRFFFGLACLDGTGAAARDVPGWTLLDTAVTAPELRPAVVVVFFGLPTLFLAVDRDGRGLGFVDGVDAASIAPTELRLAVAFPCFGLAGVGAGDCSDS